MLNKQFKFLILSVLFTLNVLGAGSYFKGPALIEGFTTITSAAGTTTLTVASQTKQIVTGATTQTIVAPDATTLPLGRKFLIINKSSGNVTVNDGSGGLLVTVAGGTQAEIHLRAAGSAAGTWDVLESSAGGGGGGTWGSITGTLSDQTDLQTALDAKADENNPGFAGTIGTTITASRLLVTDGSSNLAASATTATEAGYLSGVTGGIQTQLDAKQLRSTLTTKGDLYVATASATTARQGVGSDGQILAADSTKTNGIKWIDPVNADNLIFDGDAEAGITNFVEGSYSAATRPSGTFSASSGAGTFQISTSSSSPLFGANSFLLTKSSGASRQGRAIERTINLDSGYQTKMLKTRIDYTIVSGSFVAGSNGSSPTDSSLIWYVGQYNGSTWTYHEPSTFKMFSNSTTNKDWVEGEFQVNADTTQIKLIGFISESANSAWVVKAEVGFRLSAYLAGTPISDWVAYTPAGTWSTNTTWTGFWRRVGQDMEVKFQASLSGAPSGNFTANIPAGYTIDTTKLLSTGTQEEIGFGRIADSGSALYHFSLRYNSTVSIIGINLGASGTYVNEPSVVDSTTPITFGASDIVNGYFKVPITGWSSSTQVSDGYDGRQIVFVGKNSASTSIATTGTYVPFTSQKDSTASWSTDTFVCPSAGDYVVSAGLHGSSASNWFYAQVDKNGTLYARILQLESRGDRLASGSVIVYNCAANDTIKLKAFSDTSSQNLNASADLNFITISKLQSPTTISATEVVAARYTTINNQSLTGASTTIVNYEVKTHNTHDSVTVGAGTWSFKAPGFGFYKVQASIRAQAKNYSTGDNMVLYIYKNGVEYSWLGNWTAHTNLTSFPAYMGDSDTVQLNAGETLDVRIFTNTTINLDNNSGRSHINIERIK